MSYPLLRSLLFQLEAEKSHDLTLPLLNRTCGGRVGQWYHDRLPANPVEVFGLRFPNPVGLAAGLDKNGDFIDGLGNLGFGFLEIGTVTPRPQSGNPQPRMFRLQQDAAIINRMGFNNKGVDYLVERISRRRYSGILGINIGKNKDTPNASAIDDYLVCLHKVYAHADYITINISSPNTPGLRELQHGQARRELLDQLTQARSELSEKNQKHVPLLVKIAPDMTDEEIDDFADDAVAAGIDGIVATNTTNSRENLSEAQVQNPHAAESGGLSGKPLTAAALAVHQRLGIRLAGKIPLIGVGGIQSETDLRASYEAGSQLVQVYTGFIYQGPALIRKLARVQRGSSGAAN